MFRGVALAPVTARLRRAGHVPGVLTTALPGRLTTSRLVRRGPIGDDVAGALGAAVDRLPAVVADTDADDDAPRRAHHSSTSMSEFRRRPVVLPVGSVDRRANVRGAVGGPSRPAHRVVAPRRPDIARPAPVATTITGAPPAPSTSGAIAALRRTDRAVLVSRDADLAATLRALARPPRPSVDGAATPALRHAPGLASRPDGPAARTAGSMTGTRAPTSPSMPPSWTGSSAPGELAGSVTTRRPSSHHAHETPAPSPRPAAGGIDGPDRWPVDGLVTASVPPTDLTGLVGWWESEQASAAGRDVVGPARRPTVDAPAPRPDLAGEGDEPLTRFRDALELVLLDEALDAGLDLD